jgi:hypothetical protein
MQHADKLIERIIFLDGSPNMQTLESLRIGQTVKEVLDRDLRAETETRALYEEAATHCHGVKDYVTRGLFEQLMHDEEHIISTSSKPKSTSSPSLALSSTPNFILARSTRANDDCIAIAGVMSPAENVGGCRQFFFGDTSCSQ